MCINVVGNVHVLFWFVNVKFQGLYDLMVIDWVSGTVPVRLRFSFHFTNFESFERAITF